MVDKITSLIDEGHNVNSIIAELRKTEEAMSLPEAIGIIRNVVKYIQRQNRNT